MACDGRCGPHRCKLLEFAFLFQHHTLLHHRQHCHHHPWPPFHVLVQVHAEFPPPFRRAVLTMLMGTRREESLLYAACLAQQLPQLLRLHRFTPSTTSASSYLLDEELVFFIMNK